MFDQLREAVKGFAKVFGDLPLGKKVAISVVGILMVLGILLTSYLSKGEDKSILYSNLSQEDILPITEKLKEKGIPYTLEHGGSAITVPVKDIYQLRLELAGEGLPAGGGVGFEIFDKSTFGMTEFIQKINYRRALQGELQRTINSIASVHSSRVHIVLPRKTLFEDESSKPTASVVLKLNGNKTLDKLQVEGISYLVASSVEGLSPNDVTIVDNTGNVLSSPQEENEMNRLTTRQMEYRVAFESDMEKRIRTMLERAVGPGNVVVRVNAKFDFRQVQKTEEIYDPNSQVARSEQRLEEKSTGASLPVGVAGVQSNLPEGGVAAEVAGKPAQATKVNETINYEINKTVQTIIEPTNKLTNLSVAVMVDGKYAETKDADGNVAREFQPLADAEKTRLENLVRSAIGYDANRQDTVTIESVQFDISPLEEEGKRLETEATREFILKIMKYSGMGILGVVIFLFIIKPVVGWITTASSEMEELRQFPQTLKQMEEELETLSKPKEVKVDVRKRISDLVSENPAEAASIIRAWLRARA